MEPISLKYSLTCPNYILAVMFLAMPQQLNRKVSGSFFEGSNAKFEEEIQDHHDTLNIIVIGRVSSGKSSLINALLGKARKNSLFKVRAESGVTQQVQCLRLNDRVRLIDSPGLDDVRADNSSITRKFLERVDVGILIVEGSSDARQKQHLDDLRRQCAHIFVVFNKIDEYDKWQPVVLERVVNQWKQDLGIETIYPISVFGYDPEVHHSMKLDIRGVDALKADIEQLLEQRWHDIINVRTFSEARTLAIKIIANTMLKLTEQAFTPKSSPYILGTLAIAVTEIQHLFLGKTPTGLETRNMMALFTSGRPCAWGFLWTGGIQAPNLILDLPLANRAIVDGLAMLLALVDMLRREVAFTKINAEAELALHHQAVVTNLANTTSDKWKDLSFWHSLLPSLLTPSALSSVNTPDPQ
jgi:small GTP-binding protein